MLKSLGNKFNDMQIRSKLVFAFIISCIIPVLIVGVILTHELRTTALNEAVEESAANVDRVKKRTAETLETAIYIANNLTLNQQLKTTVDNHYGSLSEVVGAYREFDEFRYYLDAYEEISNIRLYVTNPKMINNWEFIPATREIRNSFWYKSAEQANGLFGWYYMADETKDNRKYLSLVRKIYKTDSILAININSDNLNTILAQEQSPIMIVDDNNFVVVSNRSGFIGRKLEDIVRTKEAGVHSKDTFTGTVNGEKAEIIVDLLLPDMSQNQLKFVAVIPSSVVMKEANRFVLLGLAVVAASFVIAIILIFFFSQLVSRRIVRLSRQIDQVADGNLDANVTVEGADEIGLLSWQLDHMVKNIKDLISEVEKMHREKNIMEKRQQEIKLKMMASQINPHFLFNALESIRMKAHLKGEKEISGAVKQLGKLMRKSIEVTGEMIPLRHELEMVRAYLEIQKFRYEDRLDYEVITGSNAENVLIHPLIIQPLVENAVIHGLEDKERGGRVAIEVKTSEDVLHVSVRDNGVGISREKLRSIQDALNDIQDNTANRIGLLNVHQRLILTFGADSGLVIESIQGKGTAISFTIPLGRNEFV
ncbi:sensor histidine kinase [Mesobacillus foraminis]|uniref:sensor histidine kinase n=1 Tax=Mesobacillus foraminis TaxID=279826 RepID=UPI000EF54BA1|nr:histidine kinase [Mesobacillus foraminis]